MFLFPFFGAANLHIFFEMHNKSPANMTLRGFYKVMEPYDSSTPVAFKISSAVIPIALSF